MRIAFQIKAVMHVLIMTTVLMFTAVSYSWSQSLSSNNPRQIVEHLQDTLLKSMQEGSQLDYQGRFDLLAPVIDRSHDLNYIAHVILGGHWIKLDTQQQHVFIEAFRKLSIGTYAGWFKSYNNERFEFLEQRDIPRDQVLVRSQLIQENGDTIGFDYILRQEKGAWRITNTLANGVSDLALKRSEYRSILEKKGFPSLLETLFEKIALIKKK